MTAALGFSGSGVNVAGVTRTDHMTRCDLVAQSSNRARLRLAVEASETDCLLESRLTGSDETWPPLFHRLAVFDRDGPVVRLKLDAEIVTLSAAQSMVHPWAYLDTVASEDEKTGLEELLGFATLSVELALGDLASAPDQILLSSLQSRGLISNRQLPSSGTADRGNSLHDDALTALRTSVAEYYTSGGWEHVRLQLDGSIVAGVSRDSLTFKVFRTPQSVGLEFRPLLETGEHPFQTFPGSETDEFGQVYRLTLDLLGGEVFFPEIETLRPADLALIDAIAEALYPTMRSAGIGVGHLDERTYASWTASGATFSAAFKAAKKAR